jgi:carbon-monoxide dehydrogenase large subunit
MRPGMLHACFVRSPYARATIVSIDTSAALALPGVHAVFVAADLNPRVHEAWYGNTGRDVPDTPRPPLAEGEVRFVGDPVALVVADNRYIAEDAVDLVDVEYDPLTAVPDYFHAREQDELVHEQYAANVAGSLGGAPPSTLDELFASAPHSLTHTIRQQGYCAVPMETRGIVAEWSAADGALTVWSATQAPHETRGFAARLLDLPEHRVRVVSRDVGGGFGQKVLMLREDICVLLAAPLVPGPLKWIEDRRENLISAGQARHEHGIARMAFDEEGNFLAADIDHFQDVGSYPTPWPVGTAMAVGMFYPGPYRVPKGAFNCTSVFSNTAGRTAYRGPWQFESVAREMMIDLAARKMGVDPIDLRRRNILRRDEMPYTNPMGIPYDHIAPDETFDQAITALDQAAFRREQAAALAEGRYIGVGVSTYVEPTTTGMAWYSTEGATIRVEPSGAVNVYVSGGSTGNSLETTVVQLTADALGVDIADVSTIQGDTAITPFGGGTGGSRSGSMTAGAVAVTAAELRERIIAIAAHKLEAAPDDIELAGSRASVRGSATKGISLAEIADIAYFQSATLPAGVPAGLEASGRYTAESMILWANATHVCTCEVDIVTGKVTILRYIVSEDCGPMINPNVVEGQIDGGTVQGIGGALFEHMAYDDDGNPLASTLADYLLPTAIDVPVIEHFHVEVPGPGPGGYKGVGEGGAIGSTPAVVNAVADALAPLGVIITELPLTPSRLVDLIVG